MRRTLNAVRGRATILGETIDKRKTVGGKWSNEEIEILKRYFPIEGYDIIKRLPNRSHTSICEQANRYGLLQKRKRQVICIETQRIYDTIRAAENDMGITDISSCLSGRQETAAGYHWAYVDDKKKIEQLSVFIGRTKSKFATIRKVICAETGVLYNSVKDAEKFGGPNVWNCLKGMNNTANGYHWYYEDEVEKAKEMKKYFGFMPSKHQKVICFETGKIYNSISEAEKESGATTIKRCLQDPKFTSGGYHWCTEEQYKNGFMPKQKDIVNAKKIICVETNVVYNSLTEAEILLKISGITKCIHDYSRTAGGLHWCLLEDWENSKYIVTPQKQNPRIKSVRCIETGQVFNTIHEAAKFVGATPSNICAALSGKCRTIKGYHWEYVED